MTSSTTRVLARVATAALALTAGGLAAVAAPAPAATGNVLYDCTPASPFTDPFVATAVIDTDAPSSLATRQTVPIKLSTSVVVPSDVADDLRNAGVASVVGSATVNGVVDGAPRQATLTIPSTAVPGAGNTMTLVGTGAAGTITGGAVGSTIVIGAGDFSVSLAAYNASGGVVLTGTVTCLQQGSVPAVIDSVAVVKAPTTTTLTVASPVEYGAAPNASATVTWAGGNQKPAGKLAFTYAGKTVTVDVKGGRAKADLAPALTMGANQVTAVFTPTDPTLAPSQAVAAFTVVRGPTTTTAAAVYRAARDRLVGKATVAAVHGTDVAGKVKFTLKRDGTKIRTATVDLNAKDKAKKVFKNIRKAGTYLVVAKYLGSSTLKRSVDRVKLTV